MAELVTFLVTDVEGTTVLWESRAGDMFDAMARHDAIVAETLAASGGTMLGERGEGDSTFSVFHDPVAAVRAAADLSRALAAGPWPTNLPLRVRIAVYSGEAAPRDGRYYGSTPNRAARLRALAFGGQILIGEQTRRLIADRLPPKSHLVDLGPRTLKDLSQPEQVFELRMEEFALAEDPIDDTGASNLAWLEFTASDSFVGRTEELGALTEAWKLAASGRRVLALVSGEPGIGKTTVVAELARRVREEGALILYGNWDQGALAPFQAFRDALGDYARRCPRSILHADLREQASEAARVVPEITERLADVGRPGRASAEAERHRLFEAIDGWVGAIAARRPLLLVLDDLHWADRDSLLLVRHVARTMRPSPLLVAGTYRETDLEGTELAGFLPELSRAHHLRRVALGGLPDPDVEELVGRVAEELSEPDRSALARELRDEAAGNPFFVREIVSHLDDTGVLAGLRLGGMGAGSLDIPDSVRDLIRWRTRRLGSGSRRALGVASVMGHEFAPAVVAGASGIEQERLLGLLDEAARAGLIGETPDPEPRYAFAHDVVRRALLDELGGPRRALIHRRVGEVLEGLDGRRVAPSELAYHFGRAASAGAADKAILYARLAGDRATEAAAFESAVEQYRAALDLLERFGPDDPILRCELLLSIGSGYDMIGDHASRDRWCIDAAEAARSTGRADLFARAALGYGGAWLPAAILPDAKAEALLEEALERLGDSVRPLRARVTARLAHWLQNARPYEERRPLADDALDLARRAGDPATLASVIFDRCWALDGPDDVEDELELADEVLGLADDVGVLEFLVQGMRIRLGALAERGDYEDARRTGRDYARLAHELRHPEALRLVNLWEVVEAAIEGRFEDAERLSEEQFARLQEMKHPQALLVLTGQTFAWRWLQGRAGEYLPIFSGLHASDPSNLTWSASLAWIAAETGDLEQTRSILGGLTTAAVGRIDRNYLWFGTIAGFANAAALLDDRDWAAALVERAMPYAGRNCTLGLLSFNGAMSLYLGVLLGVLRRWDEAVEQLESARERHETMGARPYAALTEQALADALLQRNQPGDRDRAEELEKAALATAAELGLQAVERRAGIRGPT